MTSPVPIIIVTYSRIKHLIVLIDSLKICDRANETDVWIFSDGAAVPDHEGIIAEVRKYVKGIKGFASVNLIAHPNNLGAVKNLEYAYNMVAKRYGRCIVMEDDLEVSRDYLRYMNDAMDRYELDPKVIGVSAYLRPELEGKRNAPFFMRRRSPYGSGMWFAKDIMLREAREKNIANFFYKNFREFKKFEPFGVNLRSFPLIHRRDLILGDIETSMFMFKENLLSLYPETNLVRNRGNDGTGLHAGIDKDLQFQTISEKGPNAFDNITTVFDLEMELLHVASLRCRHEALMNYMVYFFYKLLPAAYPFFKKFRNFSKKIRLFL